MRFEWATATDTGLVRDQNEDTVWPSPGSGSADEAMIVAVADGMGGHAGGEVASKIAADALLAFIRSSSADTEITWPFGYSLSLSVEANQLRNAIQLANQLIVNRAAAEPALQTMGSTLTVCLVKQSAFVYGNIGDSRLYLWRRGELRQISEDDSWAASMLRAGASAEMVSKHEMRHVLTRALGSPQTLDVKIGEHPLEDGDILLLCSDGLYGPVGDETIQRVLSAPGLTLTDRAEALIETANAAGGPDNITAVLIEHDTEATAVIESPFKGGSPWTGTPDAGSTPPAPPAPDTDDPDTIPSPSADHDTPGPGNDH